MTTTASGIYRFGEFRLDPAARELWRSDELVELPQFIRTISGFGYRWIGETEELPAETS